MNKAEKVLDVLGHIDRLSLEYEDVLDLPNSQFNGQYSIRYDGNEYNLWMIPDLNGNVQTWEILPFNDGSFILMHNPDREDMSNRKKRPRTYYAYDDTRKAWEFALETTKKHTIEKRENISQQGD